MYMNMDVRSMILPESDDRFLFGNGVLFPSSAYANPKEITTVPLVDLSLSIRAALQRLDKAEVHRQLGWLKKVRENGNNVGGCDYNLPTYFIGFCSKGFSSQLAMFVM